MSAREQQIVNGVRGLKFGGNKKSNNSPQITDGVHTLSTATSTYLDPNEYEDISGVNPMGNYDSTTNGLAFPARLMKSKNVTVPSGKTASSTTLDFFGLECTNLVVNGTIFNNVGRSDGTTLIPNGFAGASVTNGVATSGTNLMSGLWDFMPRGGDGGDYTNDGGHTLGGVGYSGGNDGDAVACGNGGGLVFIVADSISGIGTISANGGSDGGTTGGGGAGGIVIICTKSWSGTVGVSALQGASSGGALQATDGSYAILRIESDGTLTLMVHSDRGVSAVLNGQTPVHGADASIAW